MNPKRRAVLIRWRDSTPEERSEAARHAITARWAGKTAAERRIEWTRGRKPQPRCPCGRYTVHTAAVLHHRCQEKNVA